MRATIIDSKECASMKSKICAPRIFSRSGISRSIVSSSTFGRAICLGLILFGGTSVLSQSGSVAAASSQPPLNQRVQLDGELEILHQDLTNGTGQYFYSLKLANGARVPLQFSKRPPTHLLTGDHVRADGQLSSGSLVLYSGTSLTKTTTSTSASSTPSIPVPNTFGPQSTLVILVNFQDDTVEPYTVADAQNAFFVSANNFIQENSYGQTSLTGAVVGWYTIPDSVTTCNTSQIATDAQSAATAAGVNLSNYTRYVYAFPQNNACGFGGASNVGGNPSQSWINGTTGPGGTTLNTHIIDHELGHAFGLWHSHLYDCGTTATICSSPSIDEYGDILDTMGPPQPPSPHYSAFQKERLGWLNYASSPPIQTVTTSGTYTINPYEASGTQPNALKILKSTDPTTGAKTWYYLESRQAIGFDSFLTTYVGCEACYTQNETNGVLFHLGTDGDGNSGDLLDMTPATVSYYWWFDPSLTVGQSFQDSTAGVTVTTESATSAGATVSVQVSGSTTNAGTPALTVATNQANYNPGQTVSMSATATAGGSPAPNVAVSFVVTKANGNQITGSAKTGRNGVAVYKIRLKQTDPPGTYIAGAAATIQANSLSAASQFTVQ
jgi:M6 family metalloprotease-like protein